MSDDGTGDPTIFGYLPADGIRLGPGESPAWMVDGSAARDEIAALRARVAELEAGRNALHRTIIDTVCERDQARAALGRAVAALAEEHDLSGCSADCSARAVLADPEGSAALEAQRAKDALLGRAVSAIEAWRRAEDGNRRAEWDEMHSAVDLFLADPAGVRALRLHRALEAEHEAGADVVPGFDTAAVRWAEARSAVEEARRG